MKYTMKRNCRVCGTPFLIDHPRRNYCSPECRKEQLRLWDKERSKHKVALAKQNAWTLKKELMLKLGGKCCSCGNKDLRVLEFAHLDSKKKHPRLKSRKKLFVVTKWKIMATEVAKGRVKLQCANCHRIETHKEFWDNDVV